MRTDPLLERDAELDAPESALRVGVGAERQRGELLRWRRRLGETVEPFAGCPDELTAGIRGDWRAAAAAWREVGDPYAEALELTEGDTDARLVALAILDDLGARPAAAGVRRGLRRAGSP